MSYNYLPLDKKPLFFDQVVNLLDYDQLVSITFDAHEQILHCRDYLDKKIAAGNLLHDINASDNKAFEASKIAAIQQQLIVSHAFAEGVEIPKAIVKLTLMLKIKSLSYGKSGIDIETVKRLMEMYNNDMFPVLFSDGGFNDKAILSQLALPLIGLGTVNFQGNKMPAAAALAKKNWQALTLKSEEAIAVISGHQFTNASGLYFAKQAIESNLMEEVLAEKVLTVLMNAANSARDAIIIDAQKGAFTYQTVDNADLVAAIQLIPQI